MIKSSDGKIGTREFVSMILITIGMRVTDTTPNILFAQGKNAAWMMPLFILVVIGIPFLLLLSLLKKHEKGLMELLFNLTGKYVGGIIGFCLFFILFSSTAINSRAYTDIVNTMFYPNTPVNILLFLLLAFGFLVAKRGLETIGRTAWFIIPILELSLFSLIIFVWKDIDWMYIFPIAGPGFKIVMKESISHSSLFGEIILFAAFFSFTRSYKEFRFASLFGLVFSCLKLALFLAVFTMVFDYPEIASMAYPHQQLTRIASLGEMITHIEAIYLGFWIIASVIHFSIFLYLTAYLFAGTFRLHQFEPLILPLAGLAFFIGMLPENISQNNTYKEILLNSSSGIFILLPFFLWVVDRWKGRVKK